MNEDKCEVPGINEAWNRVRIEARSLAGIGRSFSALLTAVEAYGTACAKERAAGMSENKSEGTAGVPASAKWCPECRSAGVVGIEQDVCPTCDGLGTVAAGVGEVGRG